MELTCTHCGQIGEPRTEQKGAHLGAYCTGCGRWIKWLAQSDVPVIYIGKYSQTPMDQVWEKDPSYCRWLVEAGAGGKRVQAWLREKLATQ